MKDLSMDTALPTTGTVSNAADRLKSVPEEKGGPKQNPSGDLTGMLAKARDGLSASNKPFEKQVEQKVTTVIGCNIRTRSHNLFIL